MIGSCVLIHQSAGDLSNHIEKVLYLGFAQVKHLFNVNCQLSTVNYQLLMTIEMVNIKGTSKYRCGVFNILDRFTSIGNQPI